MSGFWDVYKPTPEKQPPLDRGPGYGKTDGVCEFCGYYDDDALLGVCPDCSKED